MLPGVPLLEYFFGIDDPVVILAILFFALGTLLLSVFSSFAYDIQRGKAEADRLPLKQANRTLRWYNIFIVR